MWIHRKLCCLNRIVKHFNNQTYIAEIKLFFNNKKQSQVKSYIKRKLESKEDWWMSSEDGIKYGFCDHIVGEKGLETIDRIVKGASRILQL